jgi:HEAT repeat protein
MPKTRGASPLASAGTKAATDAQRVDVPRDPQVKILDDLLDGDDSAATLAQAQKMTSSPKAAVRSAALDALRWLGGREAAQQLVGMLNDADADLAAAAADGLLSVLGELDDPALTAAALEQAIPKAVDGDSAEALFLSLSGLPENLSVPVLLNLLESKVTRVSALAKEYLEFVTGGQEITTRSQGEAWLRENEKQQADTEKN